MSRSSEAIDFEAASDSGFLELMRRVLAKSPLNFEGFKEAVVHHDLNAAKYALQFRQNLSPIENVSNILRSFSGTPLLSTVEMGKLLNVFLEEDESRWRRENLSVANVVEVFLRATDFPFIAALKDSKRFTTYSQFKAESEGALGTLYPDDKLIFLAAIFARSPYLVFLGNLLNEEFAKPHAPLVLADALNFLPDEIIYAQPHIRRTVEEVFAHPSAHFDLLFALTFGEVRPPDNIFIVRFARKYPDRFVRALKMLSIPEFDFLSVPQHFETVPDSAWAYLLEIMPLRVELLREPTLNQKIERLVAHCSPRNHPED